MPISGLVISLAEASSLQNDTLRELRSDRRIEIGQRHFGRVAIVAETESSQEDKALWHWIESLPGVIHVDLAFASFDPPDSHPSSGATPPSDNEHDSLTDHVNSADSRRSLSSCDQTSSVPSSTPEGSPHGC